MRISIIDFRYINELSDFINYYCVEEYFYDLYKDEIEEFKNNNEIESEDLNEKQLNDFGDEYNIYEIIEDLSRELYTNDYSKGIIVDWDDSFDGDLIRTYVIRINFDSKEEVINVFKDNVERLKIEASDIMETIL